MSNRITRRGAAILATSVLAFATTIAIPTAANAADPTCDTALGITSCQGVGSDGAAYAFSAPANFGGTLYLWSHGYRYPVDLPAAIPVVGGYKVTSVPEPAPSADVAKALLSTGFGIAGSGYSKQGWSPELAVKSQMEVVAAFKAKFPNTKKIIAWGASEGGYITQLLVDQNPGTFAAMAPLCTVSNDIGSSLAYATDILWGMQTFFDPTIVGHGYAPGLAGYAQAMGDIGKIFVALGALQAGITAGTWPETAKASPLASNLIAAGIPARSALLMVGLISGLPTQSAHFDGTTGPGDPANPLNQDYDKFALAIAPALGVLENVANAAVLGIVVNYDLEQQMGGKILDNSNRDYVAQVGDAGGTYNMALSGDAAIAGMQGVLKLAPKWTADAAAVAKLKASKSTSGKIVIPTVTMHSLNDPAVFVGNTQWLTDQYLASNSATEMYASFITSGPEHYTQFTAEGLPDTSYPAPTSTNHCNFSSMQMLTVAWMANYGAQNGVLPDAEITQFLRETIPGFSPDDMLETPRLKIYG
ncbi:MAG: prolyl oligopeptidase family serine peptidase [Actinobacteria bacterium]|uniref:Unannotated protein n=1 Tax=freshwater metagenome TaxID=449393 RepID=A0A6J6NA30_9ZZZZ|nr:prolyl oligopeptidase family serine peptidase [Actinomycetota bacterium]